MQVQACQIGLWKTAEFKFIKNHQSGKKSRLIDVQKYELLL